MKIVGMMVLGALFVFTNDAVADEPDIERWVMQLGDDKYGIRETATKELINAGEKARILLEKALSSDNAETVARTKWILQVLNAKRDAKFSTDLLEQYETIYEDLAKADGDAVKIYPIFRKVMLLTTKDGYYLTEDVKILVDAMSTTNFRGLDDDMKVTVIQRCRGEIHASDAGDLYMSNLAIPSAIPSLVLFLDDNENVRSIAKNTIRNIRVPKESSEELSRRLLPFLKSGNEKRRFLVRIVSKILRSCCSEEVNADNHAENIIVSIASEEGDIRGSLALILGELAYSFSLKNGERFSEAIAGLLNDVDEDVRSDAVKAYATYWIKRAKYRDRLTNLKKPAATLAPFLKDPSSQVRATTALALAVIEGKDYLSRIRELLTDNDHAVRGAAVIALVELGSQDNLPAEARDWIALVGKTMEQEETRAQTAIKKVYGDD